MRLGLFGGTFDPIHLGHLILAEQCREACGLDRVWLVVAGAPPHKPGGRTGVGHRLEMVRIAIAGHSAFVASDIEAIRPGPHYSVETLEAVRRDYPADELFFLIGADSLQDLPIVAGARADRATGDDRRGQPAWHRGGGRDKASGLRARLAPAPIGHDPAGRDRLERSPPPPERRPEHPLHGPPRRRGLHRCAWVCIGT